MSDAPTRYGESSVAHPRPAVRVDEVENAAWHRLREIECQPRDGGGLALGTRQLAEILQESGKKIDG